MTGTSEIIAKLEISLECGQSATLFTDILTHLVLERVFPSDFLKNSFSEAAKVLYYSGLMTFAISKQSFTLAVPVGKDVLHM